MAEDNREFILKILEDLRQNEMRKLKLILNGKAIKNCKLKNLDANKATILFLSHFEKPLETLKSILHDIPRKDLIQKISAKIEADMKNKGETQNNEKFALIKSCPGSSDHPSYTGKYTLFDLEDYATENQDQLVMHLKNILEPDEFNELKKQLMCSVLNNFFSFTAQKYYELFRNSKLREFLKDIPGKPKKIPMILFNIMFSKRRNNCKRKVQEQMQREGNINLKKKQFVNIDDDNNVLDRVTIGIENKKTIPIHPIEHKPGNEDSNVMEECWPDEDSSMATENRYEKNENEKTIPINPIKDKPGNEDSNVTEERWLDEDSRMATENRHEKNENEKTIPINPIKDKPGNEDSNVMKEYWPDSNMGIVNWYKEKKSNYREEVSLNYICIRAHQAYPCFIVQNVYQFRLPDDPDYRFLAILQDKKDFTNSRKLKKEVEFALQFNMAVLDVKFSEVISSNGFVCETQADGSFAESERVFKDIVSKIVLPVLALYKWVHLNAFDNAVYPNKESKSSFCEKL